MQSFTQGQASGLIRSKDAATHLRHLHLLHGADHVRRLLAPVALNDVALDGRAIDGHDGVSCCLVRVEPAKSDGSGELDHIKKGQKRVRLPHK